MTDAEHATGTPPLHPETITDADLEKAIALRLGYVYAGVFHGHDLYHPEGLRTQVVPLPAYTTDWNALMPLLLHLQMTEAIRAYVLGAALDGYQVTARALQRCLCEALLAVLLDLQRKETP